jgi:hypothetical protein
MTSSDKKVDFGSPEVEAVQSLEFIQDVEDDLDLDYSAVTTTYADALRAGRSSMLQCWYLGACIADSHCQECLGCCTVVAMQRTVQSTLLLKGNGQQSLRRVMLGLTLHVLHQLLAAKELRQVVHQDVQHLPNNMLYARRIWKLPRLSSGTWLL